MSQFRTVHRLEQELRMWEDACFLEGYGNRVLQEIGERPLCPVAGPLVHWQGFRQHLLHCLQEPFDAERFLGPEAVQESMGSHADAPVFLHRWMQCSRRVFHLEEDLQCLLNATSMRGIRWKDIGWPFNSFLLSLSRPLEASVNAQRILYDCVLVDTLGWESSSAAVAFRLFSTTMDEYKPLSGLEKEAVRKAFRSRNWAKYNSVNQQQQAMLRRAIRSCFLMSVPDKERIVSDTLNEVRDRNAVIEIGVGLDDFHPDQVARLAVGLCIYLSMLPGNHPNRGAWQHPQRFSRDWKAITDSAEVCVVKTTHVLTPEERSVFGGSRAGQEKCAHFRCGHWRVRPGRAGDPAAPKDVWVEPCIVRADRLPEGSVPAGSKTTIK